MTKHALLSPSSAHRWIPCPGSKEGNQLESESGEAAKQGTRQHELAAAVLAGEEVEEELWASTERFVRFVEDLTQAGGITYHVEKTWASALIPDEFFGTIDALVVDGDALYVVDLKTGRVEVPAKGNKQLLSYLCLARDQFPNAKKFYGVIVQNEIDMVQFTSEELDAFYEDVMSSLASDERHAGEHCQYCPLIMNCEENREWVYQTASITFDDQTKPDIEDCKKLIALEPIVKELAEKATEVLTQAMLGGETVEGWRLGQKWGNRAWVDPPADKGATLFGSPFFVPSLVSPAQMEKALKSAKLSPAEIEATIAPLTTREKRPPIAVRENSRVQEYVVDAGKIFEDDS